MYTKYEISMSNHVPGGGGSAQMTPMMMPTTTTHDGQFMIV